MQTPNSEDKKTPDAPFAVLPGQHFNQVPPTPKPKPKGRRTKTVLEKAQEAIAKAMAKGGDDELLHILTKASSGIKGAKVSVSTKDDALPPISPEDSVSQAGADSRPPQPKRAHIEDPPNATPEPSKPSASSPSPAPAPPVIPVPTLPSIPAPLTQPNMEMLEMIRNLQESLKQTQARNEATEAKLKALEDEKSKAPADATLSGLAKSKKERDALFPTVIKTAIAASRLLSFCRQGTPKASGWLAKGDSGKWGINVSVMPLARSGRYFASANTFERPIVTVGWTYDTESGSMQPNRDLENTSYVDAFSVPAEVEACAAFAKLDAAIREIENKNKDNSKSKVCTMESFFSGT